MSHPRTASMLAAGLGASILLTSCATAQPAPPITSSTPTASSTAATSAAPSLANESTGAVAPAGTPHDVASSLEAPWSVVFRNGTPLVSERDSARILELADDGMTRAIGTVPDVAGAGEGDFWAWLSMSKDGCMPTRRQPTETGSNASTSRVPPGRWRSAKP